MENNSDTEAKIDKILLILEGQSKRARARAKKQDMMFKRLEAIEKEIKELKEIDATSRIDEESRKISKEIERSLDSLSEAERRIYSNMSTLNERDGEITLKPLEEMSGLDYKTVAGYARLFTKYGLIIRKWDHSRRINKYLLAHTR